MIPSPAKWLTLQATRWRDAPDNLKNWILVDAALLMLLGCYGLNLGAGECDVCRFSFISVAPTISPLPRRV